MIKKSGNLFQTISSFLRDELWNLEPTSLSGMRARALKFLRVCTLVVKGFREDQCPLHAAALTFISVMAMVPFLTIVFGVAKGFGFEKASEMITSQADSWPDALQQAITTILATVESASAGAMAGYGLVLTLWVAIKMLSNIEETLNTVWGISDSRAFSDKVRNYIVIIVVTPILLIVATTAQPVIMNITSKLEWMGPFLTFALQGVPLVMMSCAFCVVYIFLPNTKVNIGAAFTGAIAAALLSVIFQYLMIHASVGIGRNSAVYGTLAAIPIFLFYVQTSWMILLMGAEVACSVQNANTFARERLAVTPSPHARLCMGLALMKHITAQFETLGAPFNIVEYGQESRIPVRLINDVISTLCEANLITESTMHPGCYTLLQTPRNVSALNIVNAVLDKGASPASLGLAPDLALFGEITDDGNQLLASKLLSDFYRFDSEPVKQVAIGSTPLELG